APDALAVHLLTAVCREVAQFICRRRAEAEVERLSQDRQQRIEELQALMDALPVGIGIAHDPECRHVTLNPYCARLLGVPARPPDGAAVSAPALPPLRREGRELAPSETPLRVAAASGVRVRDF